MTTFCPASMCPLIAPKGSPWTGAYNTNCQGKDCAWFNKKSDRCEGSLSANLQIDEVLETGRTLQLGSKGHFHDRKPLDYQCPREHECQWQKEADRDQQTCPPRRALKEGKDPRICLY
jgi:hypothetical protein